MIMKKIVGVSLLTVLMLVSSLPLVLDRTDAGRPIFVANVKVITNTTHDNYDQIPTDLETAPSGRIYLAFQSAWKYYNDVYITHSDDLGETWSEQVMVDDSYRDGNDSNDRSNQGRPSMAIAPNGTVYVAWNDKRDKNAPAQIRIAWAEDGEDFTRSIKVDPKRTFPNWEAAEPRIAFAENGRLICVWRDKMNDGSYFHIWGSYSDDAGYTWAPPVRINTDPYFTRDHRNMRIAVHEEMVYVTWEDNRDDGTDATYRPYLAISSDGGETYGAERAVCDDSELGNNRGSPYPSVDDQGDLYIVWRDRRTGRDEIWFTTSSDGGSTLGPNKKITKTPEASFSDSNPCIECSGDGMINVIFQREGPDAGKTDIGDIYYIGSPNGGLNWTDPIRVDDSDRWGVDAIAQIEPVIGLDQYGDAISAWQDDRMIESRPDIFFSRHSGLPGSADLPAQIRMMESFSPFSNRNMTSAVARTSFRFLYLDPNNDLPAEGYPKVTVYADPAGSSVLVPPTLMTQEDPTDFDFMDGSHYSVQIVLNTSGFVYYRIDVASERDPMVIRSAILKGPLVDSETPTVEILEPIGKVWIQSTRILVRAMVHDTGGAGIDNLTIKVKTAVNGPESMQEKGVRLKNLNKTDDDNYEAWGYVNLDGSDDNYVAVEVYDRVANGPGTSVPRNVWIDVDAPYFTDVRPRNDIGALYEDVNCSILWMDHVPGSRNVNSSGLDLSSVQYRYRTTSGPMSEWLSPDGIIDQGKSEFRAYVRLRFFDDGVYNFIQWRAADKLGQLKQTGEIRVNIQVPDNYPPIWKEAKMYPSAVVSSTPHLFWDDAFDEEGDPLFYSVMILTYPYRLFIFSAPIGIGARTFFDVPNSAKLDPGYYVLQVNVTDRIGGYEVGEWRFRILEDGTPPPADIPPIKRFYIPDTNRTIEWDPSPGPGESTTYMARLGTEPWMGDVQEWKDIGEEPELNLSYLDLGLGVYSFQVMAHSNGNYSRVADTTLKVNDYDIVSSAPYRHTGYRGKAAIKKPALVLNLTNIATYDDNVTLRVSGGIVDKGWVYFADSGRPTHTVLTKTQKILTVKTPQRISILVYPPSNAEKGTYPITITVRSEDGSVQYESAVNVTIADVPSDSIIQEVANDVYDLIIRTFPFLRPIPQSLLLPLFFLITAVLVLAIVGTTTWLYRREVKRRKSTDPYAEHKRVYKEMYGVEPSQDALDKMIIDGGLPAIPKDDAPIKAKEFDESFLESEEGIGNKPKKVTDPAVKEPPKA
jgi:hypothetical protein